MAQLLDRDALQPQARGEREKAIKILAKSIYRQMRETGYDTREIVVAVERAHRPHHHRHQARHLEVALPFSPRKSLPILLTFA